MNKGHTDNAGVNCPGTTGAYDPAWEVRDRRVTLGYCAGTKITGALALTILRPLTNTGDIQCVA